MARAVQRSSVRGYLIVIVAHFEAEPVSEGPPPPTPSIIFKTYVLKIAKIGQFMSNLQLQNILLSLKK
jgi:hypothetical protein